MSKIHNAVGVLIGSIFAMALDAVTFAAVVAIPMAAFVIIGVIGQPLAITFVTFAAGIGAIQVLLRMVLKAI